jgi:hypothetical protein
MTKYLISGKVQCVVHEKRYDGQLKSMRKEWRSDGMNGKMNWKMH